MKANINGTEIYFDVAGMQLAPVKDQFVDRPVVFLLHGGPGGDHLRYKLHTLELAKIAQLVFIDYRGCGQSKQTKTRDYTLKNNIEDIEALRKHLGLNKIIMLGTSYGGMVAMGYALKYQRHLHKLILVATSPSHRFLQSAKSFLAKHGTKQQISVAKKLWTGSFKNTNEVNHFFKIMEPLYSATSPVKNKFAYAKSTTRWSYAALNQGFKKCLRTFDFIPKLKRIKVPTLILAGGKDWISRPEQAKLMAKAIPNARLKIFPLSSHAIAIDAHRQYINIISRFIKTK